MRYAPCVITEFDVTGFQAALGKRNIALGDPLKHTAETGSTNTDATEAAKRGAPHGALFVSDHQSAGRGRRGATWTSSPGENLLFSLVLRPPGSVQSLTNLTLALGLGVAEALDGFVSPAATVKWPNDIYVNNAKLGGILVETHTSGATVDFVVVGIGLNVHLSTQPPGLDVPATSVALASNGQAFTRESLLVAVLNRLDERIREHAASGLDGMISAINARSYLQGRAVDTERLSGTVVGIDASGALLIDVQGRSEAVRSGTVRLAGG